MPDVKIESYLLTVSIPNHIGIQAAYLYSDAMFVTLNRGPYRVLSSGRDEPGALLHIIKARFATPVTPGETRVSYAPLGQS